MFQISDWARFALFFISAIGTITVSLLLIPLENNISRLLREKLMGLQQGGRQPAHRPLHYWLILGVIILLSVLTGAAASTFPPLLKVTPMRGNFNIVVASFAGGETGHNLAENVKFSLDQDIHRTPEGSKIVVWGPDDLEPMGLDHINGQSAFERAAQAENLAGQISANLVIYGGLGTNQKQTVFTPEFYLSANNFFEAQEITGPQQFGAPVYLKPSEIGGKIQLNSEMFTRCYALANISTGLSHYFDQDYDQALTAYQVVEQIQASLDPQSKKILYLLMGNAALQRYNQLAQTKNAPSRALLDQSQYFYQSALQLDQNYARTYIGLGSIAYLNALFPFEQSKKPSDIDGQLLAESKANYQTALDHYTADQQARKATDPPDLSDVDIKVQFGFGQVDLMQVYSGRETNLTPSINELGSVIKSYANGANPRIHDLAAEAYARQGFAYDLAGHPSEAAQDYQMAADLLSEGSARKEHYQTRADTLKQVVPTP